METLLLGPLRSYITARLLSALKQYVTNISVEALGVLGSDLVLNSLELRLETLRHLIPLPPGVELTRGFVRELRIHIPWTSLLSSPIEVKLDTLEVVFTSRTVDDERKSAPLRRSTLESPGTGQSQGQSNPEGSGLPAWIQFRIARILANVQVGIQNLVVKYSQGGHSLVLGMRSISAVSADPDRGWTPAFAELAGKRSVVCKTIAVRDLSLNFGENGASRRRTMRAESSASGQGLGGSPCSPPDKASQNVAQSTMLPRMHAAEEYLEESLLNKCNVLIRAQLVLDPDGRNSERSGVPGRSRGPSVASSHGIAGTDDAGQAVQRAADSSTGRERPSMAHRAQTTRDSHEEQQQVPVQEKCVDPFDSPILAWFPGTLQYLGDPAAAAIAGNGALPRPVPIDAAVTFLHVYVDTLECGCSGRQARALVSFSAQAALNANRWIAAKTDPLPASTGMPQVDSRASFDVHDPRNLVFEDSANLEDAGLNGEHDSESGVISWLWSTVVGNPEDDAIAENDDEDGEGSDFAAQGMKHSESQGIRRENSVTGSPSRFRAIESHSVEDWLSRALVLNVHVGSASLTLHRHMEKVANVGDSQVAPGRATAGTSSGVYSTFKQGGSSSVMLVPVARLGYVSVDASPKKGAFASGAKLLGGNDPSNPLVGRFVMAEEEEDTPQRFVPIPFLRLSVEASWLHTRILQPLKSGTGDPTRLAGAEEGHAGNTRDIKVTDLYLDVGTARLHNWSSAHDTAYAENRAVARARAIALLHTATSHVTPGVGMQTPHFGPSSHRPPALSAISMHSLPSDGAAGRGRGSSAASGDGPSSTGVSVGATHGAPISSPSSPAFVRAGQVQTTTAVNFGGFPRDIEVPRLAVVNHIVWGRPSDLDVLVLGAARSGGLVRHPYFHCSLMPEIDAEAIASPDAVLKDDNLYSMYPVDASFVDDETDGGALLSPRRRARLGSHLAARMHIVHSKRLDSKAAVQHFSVIAASISVAADGRMMQRILDFIAVAVEDEGDRGSLEQQPEQCEGEDDAPKEAPQQAVTDTIIELLCGGLTLVAASQTVPPSLLTIGTLEARLSDRGAHARNVLLLQGLSQPPSLIPSYQAQDSTSDVEMLAEFEYPNLLQLYGYVANVHGVLALGFPLQTEREREFMVEAYLEKLCVDFRQADPLQDEFPALADVVASGAVGVAESIAVRVTLSRWGVEDIPVVGFDCSISCQSALLSINDTIVVSLGAPAALNVASTSESTEESEGALQLSLSASGLPVSALPTALLLKLGAPAGGMEASSAAQHSLAATAKVARGSAHLPLLLQFVHSCNKLATGVKSVSQQEVHEVSYTKQLVAWLLATACKSDPSSLYAPSFRSPPGVALEAEFHAWRMILHQSPYGTICVQTPVLTLEGKGGSPTSIGKASQCTHGMHVVGGSLFLLPLTQGPTGWLSSADGGFLLDMHWTIACGGSRHEKGFVQRLDMEIEMPRCEARVTHALVCAMAAFVASIRSKTRGSRRVNVLETQNTQSNAAFAGTKPHIGIHLNIPMAALALTLSGNSDTEQLTLTLEDSACHVDISPVPIVDLAIGRATLHTEVCSGDNIPWLSAGAPEICRNTTASSLILTTTQGKLALRAYLVRDTAVSQGTEQGRARVQVGGVSACLQSGTLLRIAAASASLHDSLLLDSVNIDEVGYVGMAHEIVATEADDDTHIGRLNLCLHDASPFVRFAALCTAPTVDIVVGAWSLTVARPASRVQLAWDQCSVKHSHEGRGDSRHPGRKSLLKVSIASVVVLIGASGAPPSPPALQFTDLACAAACECSLPGLHDLMLHTCITAQVSAISGCISDAVLANIGLMAIDLQPMIATLSASASLTKSISPTSVSRELRIDSSVEYSADLAGVQLAADGRKNGSDFSLMVGAASIHGTRNLAFHVLLHASGIGLILAGSARRRVSGSGHARLRSTMLYHDRLPVITCLGAEPVVVPASSDFPWLQVQWDETGLPNDGAGHALHASGANAAGYQELYVPVWPMLHMTVQIRTVVTALNVAVVDELQQLARAWAAHAAQSQAQAVPVRALYEPIPSALQVAAPGTVHQLMRFKLIAEGLQLSVHALKASKDAADVCIACKQVFATVGASLAVPGRQNPTAFLSAVSDTVIIAGDIQMSDLSAGLCVQASQNGVFTDSLLMAPLTVSIGFTSRHILVPYLGSRSFSTYSVRVPPVCLAIDGESALRLQNLVQGYQSTLRHGRDSDDFEVYVQAVRVMHVGLQGESGQIIIHPLATLAVSQPIASASNAVTHAAKSRDIMQVSASSIPGDALLAVDAYACTQRAENGQPGRLQISDTVQWVSGAYAHLFSPGRNGAWWGSMSWSYTVPVNVPRVSVSAPAAVALHSILRMTDALVSNVSSIKGKQMQRVAVPIESAPHKLFCVLERLAKSSNRSKEAWIPVATFAVPVASKAAIAPSPNSAFTAGMRRNESATRRLDVDLVPSDEVIDYALNFRLVDHQQHSRSVAANHEGSGVGGEACASVESVLGTASSCWRVRWMESGLTESHFLGNDADQQASTSIHHAPYSSVCIALAAVLRLHTTLCATVQDSSGTEHRIPFASTLSLQVQVPSVELSAYQTVKKKEMSAPLALIQMARVNVDHSVSSAQSRGPSLASTSCEITTAVLLIRMARYDRYAQVVKISSLSVLASLLSPDMDAAHAIRVGDVAVAVHFPMIVDGVCALHAFLGNRDQADEQMNTLLPLSCGSAVSVLNYADIDLEVGQMMLGGKMPDGSLVTVLGNSSRIVSWSLDTCYRDDAALLQFAVTIRSTSVPFWVPCLAVDEALCLPKHARSALRLQSGVLRWVQTVRRSVEVRSLDGQGNQYVVNTECSEKVAVPVLVKVDGPRGQISIQPCMTTTAHILGCSHVSLHWAQATCRSEQVAVPHSSILSEVDVAATSAAVHFPPPTVGILDSLVGWLSGAAGSVTPNVGKNEEHLPTFSTTVVHSVTNGIVLASMGRSGVALAHTRGRKLPILVRVVTQTLEGVDVSSPAFLLLLNRSDIAPKGVWLRVPMNNLRCLSTSTASRPVMMFVKPALQACRTRTPLFVNISMIDAVVMQTFIPEQYVALVDDKGLMINLLSSHGEGSAVDGARAVDWDGCSSVQVRVRTAPPSPTSPSTVLWAGGSSPSSPSVAGLAALDAFAGALSQCTLLHHDRVRGDTGAFEGHASLPRVSVTACACLMPIWSLSSRSPADLSAVPGEVLKVMHDLLEHGEGPRRGTDSSAIGVQNASWQGDQTTAWRLVHAGWIADVSGPHSVPGIINSADAALLVRVQPPMNDRAPEISFYPTMVLKSGLPCAVAVQIANTADPELIVTRTSSGSTRGHTTAIVTRKPFAFELQPGMEIQVCLLPILSISSGVSALRVQIHAGETSVELLVPMPRGIGRGNATHVLCDLPWPSAPSMRIPVSASLHIRHGEDVCSDVAPPLLVLTLHPRATVVVDGLRGCPDISSWDGVSGSVISVPALHVGNKGMLRRYAALVSDTSLALIHSPPVAIALQGEAGTCCAALLFRLGEGDGQVPGHSAGTHWIATAPVFRGTLAPDAVRNDIDTSAALLSMPSIPPGHAVHCLWPPAAAAPEHLRLLHQQLLRAEVVYDPASGVTCFTMRVEEHPSVQLDARDCGSGKTMVQLAQAARVLPRHAAAWQHAYCSPLERIAVLSGLIRRVEASLRAARALQAPKSGMVAPMHGVMSTSGSLGPAGTPVIPPVCPAGMQGFSQFNMLGSPSGLDSVLTACEVAVAQAKASLESDLDSMDEAFRGIRDVDGVLAQDSGRCEPEAPMFHPLMRLQLQAQGNGVGGRDTPFIAIQGGEVQAFDWLLLVDTGLSFARLRRYSAGESHSSQSSSWGGPSVARRLFVEDEVSASNLGSDTSRALSNRAPLLVPFPMPWVPAFPACWSPAGTATPQAQMQATSGSPLKGGASGLLGQEKASSTDNIPPNSGRRQDSAQAGRIMPADLDVLHCEAEVSANRCKRLVHAAAHWRAATRTMGLRPSRVFPADQVLAQQYQPVRVSCEDGHLGQVQLVPASEGDVCGPVSANAEPGQVKAPIQIACPWENGAVRVPLCEARQVLQIRSSATGERGSLARSKREWSLTTCMRVDVVSLTVSLLRPQLTLSRILGAGELVTTEIACLHVLHSIVRVDTRKRGTQKPSHSVRYGVGFIQLDDLLSQPDHGHGHRQEHVSQGEGISAPVPLLLGNDNEGQAAHHWVAGTKASTIAGSGRRCKPALCGEIILDPAATSNNRTLGASGSALRKMSIFPGRLDLHVVDTIAAQHIQLLSPWSRPLARAMVLAKSVIQLGSSTADLRIDEYEAVHTHTSLPMFTCDRMEIGSLDATLIIRMGWHYNTAVQGGSDTASTVLLPLFSSLGSSCLSLSGMTLDRPLCTRSRLAQELLASALADVLLSSPALLGSLDILGNPSNLVRSIAAGVVGLVTEPARAWAGAHVASSSIGGRVGEELEGEGQQEEERDHPAMLALVGGVARGMGSFASHLSEGLLSSISGVTLSLARSVRRVTTGTAPPGDTSLEREEIEWAGQQGDSGAPEWARDEPEPGQQIVPSPHPGWKGDIEVELYGKATEYGPERHASDARDSPRPSPSRPVLTILRDALLWQSGAAGRAAGEAIALALDSIGQGAASVATALSVEGQPHHVRGPREHFLTRPSTTLSLTIDERM